VEEVRAIESTVTGRVHELAVPHRHFVAEFDCEAVVDFVQKSSPARHPRKLLLFNDMLLVRGTGYERLA
jgi:hypothetical protein